MQKKKKPATKAKVQKPQRPLYTTTEGMPYHRLSWEPYYTTSPYHWHEPRTVDHEGQPLTDEQLQADGMIFGKQPPLPKAVAEHPGDVICPCC